MSVNVENPENGGAIIETIKKRTPKGEDETQTTEKIKRRIDKVRTTWRWCALFLLFIGVAFFACGGNNTKTNTKSDGTHVFRNANFGMSAA